MAINIPGKPLQSFGGSLFFRTGPTTASYLLADRSNLGVDVVNGQSLVFHKLMTAPAPSPFIGQLIWSIGPGSGTRVGTIDETHSGPNGMATYSFGGHDWLFVGDGGCNFGIPGATKATSAAAGTMGACGTPADPSTVAPGGAQSTAVFSQANCTAPGGNAPPGATNCYPDVYQPNVKVFNLKTDTFAFSFPTGGPGYGAGPVANRFGAAKADSIEIGTQDVNGVAYMLVSSLDPFLTAAGGVACGAGGHFNAASDTAAAGGSFPYLTLYTITPNGAAPPTVTYQATIKVDDTSAAATTPTIPTNQGPFGCDYNARRPGNPFGALQAIHFDPKAGTAGAFLVSLPNVINNVPIITSNSSGSATPGQGAGQANVPDGGHFLPFSATVNPQLGQGCYFPAATPAAANLVDQSGNPANGGFFWNCDGGLLLIDPRFINNTPAAQPNVMPFITAYVPGAINPAGGVVKVPYCSPGITAAGPNDISGNFPGTYDNLFLGCSPKYNGNLAGTGSAPSIAETYSLTVNVLNGTEFGSSPANLLNIPGPGPFPATDAISPFNQTLAAMNGNWPNSATPPTLGCSTQSGTRTQTGTPPDLNNNCLGPLAVVTDNANPAVSWFTAPGGFQIPGGAILSQPFGPTFVSVNGVTTARLNISNFATDPHWYAAVGGAGFSTANIANLATKTAGIAYIDALSNLAIEFTTTSSGSNTVALDEQNYLALVPINAVVSAAISAKLPAIPAGDFTANGVKICGNGVTSSVTHNIPVGPGCVAVFRQQFLSAVGSNRHKGN